MVILGAELMTTRHENEKEQFKKLRIVLGPIEIKDPFDNTKTYPCTIGDIPITLNYLTDFLPAIQCIYIVCRF